MLRISQTALLVAALVLAGPAYARDSSSSAAAAASPLAAAGAAGATGDTSASAMDDGDDSAMDDGDADDSTLDDSALDDSDDASTLDDSGVSSSSEAPALSTEDLKNLKFEVEASATGVTAVQSSMDDAALTEAVTGGLSKHRAELQALKAASITIPELKIVETFGMPSGETTVSNVSYRDIVVTNVSGGVAETVVIGTTEITGEKGLAETVGKTTLHKVDLAGYIGFSSGEAGDATQPLKVIATDMRVESLKLTADKFSCEVGPTTQPQFEARPFKKSFKDIFEDLRSVTPNSAEQGFAALAEFGDFFSAVKFGETKVGAVSCTGTDESNQPVSIAMTGATVGAFGGVIFPSVEVDGLNVAAPGNNNVKLAKLVIKGTDVSSIANVFAPGAVMNDAWLQANGRRLIPSFPGISFAGLGLDVADPESPGGRLQATVDDFDLTLGDYINGIPSKLSTASHGIHFPLPTTSTDETISTLIALGMKDLNLGYDFSIGWDKPSQTIRVDKFSINGMNLGSVSIATTLGNALEELFAVDTNTAVAASAGLTFKDSSLNVTDAGLADLVIPLLAGQMGVDPATYRTQMAGVAEGFALQVLGSTDEARALGKALGDFVAGRTKSVTVNVAAKSAGGVPLPMFEGASEDPSKLIPLLSVSGSSQ